MCPECLEFDEMRSWSFSSQMLFFGVKEPPPVATPSHSRSTHCFPRKSLSSVLGFNCDLLKVIINCNWKMTGRTCPLTKGSKVG